MRANTDWINADDNYVRIHAAGENLSDTRDRERDRVAAGSGALARIRRSTIIRVDRIREVSPPLNGTYEVVLQDGTRLTSARWFRGDDREPIR